MTFRSLWCRVAVIALLFVVSARADSYDAMRVNWFNNLTGGTAYDATDPDVAAATTSLTANANAYWTILKATKPFTTTPFSDIAIGSNSDNITDVYNRLETMCLAYWAIGGSLYQNATLKADIISTLDWLNTNVYNSTTKSYGNWFAWQIGIPLNLNNITILLYDSLSATQVSNYMGAVNHFTSSPTQVSTTGANCAWCSSIVGLRGVIVKDSTKISAASKQFGTLTAYVTSPDGFYTDGSYIGHGSFSYNGGYGLYMLQQLADGYYLFNPTALSPLSAGKRAIVYGWVLNSYQALMYQGKIPYYSIGREISRGPSDGRGESISATAAEIAVGDASATATQVLAFAKNVFTASGSNYSDLGGIGAVIRLKSLVGNTAIAAAADPVGTRIFPAMDKATAVQNGWSAGLAYYSTRTCNYESINGENLKGWHQADGMTYLDNADWNQFNGNFWATVNPQRLPGTTVTAGSTPTQGLANGSTFAGGADLGGLYGAVGFTLQPGGGQSLVANKAWFLFDDEVVCLGSGITSTGGVKVETIIENRKLNAAGSNALTVGGATQPTTRPWSSAQNGVSWMHLAGSVPGADIGYYFPGGANLDFTRETRTGSWSAIGVGSTASVSDSYLTVGQSHGVSPAGGSYAYVLLPNYTAAQTAAYAAAPVATVLENDANVSAVRDA
ncbi:MAG: polysaccharide lyase 8 family protein, partial [Rhodospirillales bacterium]|nr:polysaccharide lyase 8 family protein [Acetobacter sp.]